MSNKESLKIYSWNPAALTKCRPEKQIELWNGMLARIDQFYSALETCKKQRNEVFLNTGASAKELAEKIVAWDLDLACILDSKSTNGQ